SEIDSYESEMRPSMAADVGQGFLHDPLDLFAEASGHGGVNLDAELDVEVPELPNAFAEHLEGRRHTNARPVARLNRRLEALGPGAELMLLLADRVLHLAHARTCSERIEFDQAHDRFDLQHGLG